MWEHERLVVYRKAVEAFATLHPIILAMRGDRTDLDDELKRAASSMVLNVAEGASEYRTREKARFYRMAKRSAAECASWTSSRSSPSGSPSRKPRAVSVRSPLF